MVERERHVLHFKLSSWVKACAIVQLVAFTIGILLLITMTVTVFVHRKEFGALFQMQLDHMGVKVTYGLATFYTIIWTSLLHSTVLGIFGGITLLKAVTQKSSQLLKWWLIFAATTLAFGLVSVIISAILCGSIMATVGGLLGFSSYGAGMWFVYSHMCDLQHQRSNAGTEYKA